MLKKNFVNYIEEKRDEVEEIFFQNVKEIEILIKNAPETYM